MHPHGALGPLTFFLWAAFVGAHEARHAAQIQEIGAERYETICQECNILVHKAHLMGDGARGKRTGSRITVQELTRQGLYVVVKPPNRTELLARLVVFRQ